MNSKELSKIKTDLKRLLKDKDVLDVIAFGSAVKGKLNPADIDIAVISEKECALQDERYHISSLTPKDLLARPTMLTTALLREGYSIKHNKPFSERFGFTSKALFIYDLRDLTASRKVKIVNILRGKDGLVEKSEGRWLSRQVFVAPVSKDRLFEDLFDLHGIRYRRSYILMH